jgi:hypothetical protein
MIEKGSVGRHVLAISHLVNNAFLHEDDRVFLQLSSSFEHLPGTRTPGWSSLLEDRRKRYAISKARTMSFI